MDLRALSDRRRIIWHKINRLSDGIRCLRPSFYGQNDRDGFCMGAELVFNSQFSAHQLEFALAMSTHPLVDDLLNDSREIIPRWNPTPFVEQKVLRGLKVLDLGCGAIPSFARCARKMGADVYTVDLFKVEDLQYSLIPPYFTLDDRNLEVKNHICVDLDSEGSTDAILAATEGNFDLVTEAHLRSPTLCGQFGMVCSYAGRGIARKLLNSQGVYFCVDHDKDSFSSALAAN